MTLTTLIRIKLLLEQDAAEHQRLVERRRDRVRELEDLIDRGESEAELREQLADAQDAYDAACKERSAAKAALRELMETDFRG